jgi:ABC-type glycerol-3-phosphate transport system substrate-binding protein
MFEHFKKESYMITRKFRLFAIALLSAVVLAGCGGAPSKAEMEADEKLFEEYFDKCDSGEIDEDAQVCQDVVDIIAESFGNILGF